MQAQLQLADARLTGAQQGEQGAIFGLVVQSVGGKTQEHVGAFP
jgi:hypothetical protein